MHYDMVMSQCKSVSPRSLANEMAMTQYKAISEMTKIHYKLSRMFVS